MARSFLLAALAVALASGAAAQTSVVIDDLSDGGANPSHCSSTDGVAGNCSLRDALVGAGNGDYGTITFDASLNGQTISLGSKLDPLYRSVTIDATSLSNGISISGQEGYQVFEVTSGTLTLRGLTIRDGRAQQGGGLAVHLGAAAVAEGVRFTANTAGTGGGAVYVEGGTFTADRSSFDGNASDRGPAILSNGGTVTVTASSVVGNTPYSGAAIESMAGYGAAQFRASAVRLVNSTVAENTNVGVLAFAASVDLVNTVIASASGATDCAIGSGGMVSLSYAHIADGSCGASSSTPGSSGASTGPAGLVSRGAAGPLAAPVWGPRLRSPLVDTGSCSSATDVRGQTRPIDLAYPNVANGCDIGAVEATAAEAVFQGSPVVTKVGDGDDGTCDADCSLREALAAPATGPVTFAASLNGQTLTVGTTLTTNRDVTVDASSLAGGVAISGGNATRVFETSAGALTLRGLTVRDGNAGSGDGGLIRMGPGTGLSANAVLFSGGRAGRGGAIFVRNDATASVEGARFTANTATGDGGAVFVEAGTFTASRSSFDGNTGGVGGAVYSNGGTATLTASSVVGNTATNLAAVYSRVGYGAAEGRPSTVRVVGSTVAENTATGGVSGVMAYGAGTTLALVSSAVTSASEWADCAWDAGGYVSLSYAHVADGYCGASSSTPGASGASTGTAGLVSRGDVGPLAAPVWGPGATSPLTDAGSCSSAGTTDVLGRTRPVDIGAVANAADGCDIGAVEATAAEATFQGSPVVTKTTDSNDRVCDADCSLREALATSATGPVTFAPSLNGQTLTVGTPLVTNRDVTVDASGLSNGVAVSGGGATRVFEAAAGTLTLRGLTVRDGRADRGAGLYVRLGATASVEGARFTANTATGDGGAVFVEGGTFTANRSSFDGNTGGIGGAVYSNGGTATLTTTSIVGNTATQTVGGVYSRVGYGAAEGRPSTVRLVGSTVAENTAGSGVSGVLAYGAGTTLALESTVVASASGRPDCATDGGTVSLSYAHVEDGSCGASSSTAGASGASTGTAGLVSRGAVGPLAAPLWGPGVASPLVDAGTCSGATDLRGGTRPVDIGLLANAADGCDIGVVEATAAEVFGPGQDLLVDMAEDTQAFSSASIAECTDGVANGNCSLREAIALANNTTSTSTVQFADGLAGQTLTVASQLATSQDMTLDATGIAGGVALSGGDATRVIDVTGGTLTLRGLTVRDGNAGSGDGGLIQVGPGTGLLADAVRFSGGQAGRGGAIIVGIGATVAVKGSRFTANTSTGDGGAVLVEGGTFTADRSSFDGNTGNIGGAVYSNGGTATLTASSVVGNTATERVGGVYSRIGYGAAQSRRSTVRLVGSTVAENTASGGTSGVEAQGATVELVNTVVASTSEGADCASYGGSTVSLSYGHVEDGSCGASSSGTAGLVSRGAVGPLAAPVWGPSVFSPLVDAGTCAGAGTTDLLGRTRPIDLGYANTADGCDIGAVEATEAEAGSFLSSPVVTKAADTNDGVCDADCSLREALALATLGTTITFAEALAGQTLTVDTPLESVRDVTLDASALAGGVAVSGGDATRVIDVTGGTLTLRGLTVRDGAADRGAGLFVRNGAAATVEGARFTANTSTGDGGAVFVEGGTFTATRSSFDGNTGGVGGAVYSNGGTATLTTSSVVGNTATQTVGGVYSRIGYGAVEGRPSTVRLVGSTVVENTAPSGASGVASLGSGTTVALVSTVVASASERPDCATDQGGTVSLSYGHVEDGTCGASSSTAGASGASTGTAGLVSRGAVGPLAAPVWGSRAGSPLVDAGTCDGSSTTDLLGRTRPTDLVVLDAADGCDIGAVEATEAEAGSFLSSPVVTKAADTNDGVCDADCSLREALALAVPGTTVTFAEALAGQTLTVDTPLLTNRDVTLDASALAGGVAVSGGDATRVIDVTGGTLTLRGLTVRDGAADRGAGLFVRNGAAATVEGARFTANTSTGDGGAVYAEGGTFTATRSSFDGNTASYGAAVYTNGSTATLTASSVVGNTTTNFGAVLAQVGFGAASGRTSTVRLVGSTVAENASGSGASGVASLGAGTTVALVSTVVASASERPDCATDQGGTVSLSYAHVEDGSCGASSSTAGASGASTGTAGLVSRGTAGPLAAPVWGPVRTSPLVDAGSCSVGDATDGRRGARPVDIALAENADGGCDIGAIEATESEAGGLVTAPVVTKAADTNDGVCDADCSLREAITLATLGTTVTFAEALAGQTLTVDTTLVSVRDVTIDASALAGGVALSGGSATRVIDVTGGTLTLRGLTVRDGAADKGAGLIVRLGATAAVEGARFTANTATGDGGAVFVEGGTFTADRSSFDGNTGGVGGAVYSNGGTATLTTSSVVGNTATATVGGVYSRSGYDAAGGRPSTVRLVSSTVAENTATGGVSGVMAYGAGTTLALVSTVIASASERPDCATDQGGTVSLSYGHVEDGTCGASSSTAGASGASTGAAGLVSRGTAGPLAAPLWGPSASSPLVDAGTCASATDLRGQARPVDLSEANAADGCDIGAIEATANEATLATYLVDAGDDSQPYDAAQSAADCTDGEANGNCTLREALLAANSGNAFSRIHFEVADATIRPTRALPDLTQEGTRIDGRTQPGGSVAILGDAAGTGDVDGLRLAGVRQEVYGLSVRDFSRHGIVAASGASNVLISGNTVSGNRVGVFVTGGAQRVAIVGNAISDNRALGIDLGAGDTADGVTPNDAGDVDTGGNGLQNFPELYDAGTAGATFTLKAEAWATYRIEAFASSAADPSGYGEGARSVGALTVVTNGSGEASGTVEFDGVSAGEMLAATATRVTGADNDEYGGTSEFSQAIRVGNAATPDSPPSELPLLSCSSTLISYDQYSQDRSFRVPGGPTSTYRISFKTAGAAGGQAPGASGGRGLVVNGVVTLRGGTRLDLQVGQGGTSSFSTAGGGGGGGTAVVIDQSTLLVLAGGGGGGTPAGVRRYPGLDQPYSAISGQDAYDLGQGALSGGGWNAGGSFQITTSAPTTFTDGRGGHATLMSSAPGGTPGGGRGAGGGGGGLPAQPLPSGVYGTEGGAGGGGGGFLGGGGGGGYSGSARGGTSYVHPDYTSAFWTHPFEQYNAGGGYVVVSCQPDGTTGLDVATTLTGSEGWRLLAAPVADQTVGSLFEPIWTQGFPGADVGFGTPNVYTHSEAAPGDRNQGYGVPAAATDPAAPGKGFVVYVLEDPDFNGPIPAGFPQTLSVNGTPLVSDFTFPVTYTDTGDATADDYGWNLVGNPYALGLNVDAPGWTRQNVDQAIYVYDPAYGGGGGYRVWAGGDGTLGSSLIAPFQGFWVKATGASPSFVAPASAQVEGGIIAGISVADAPDAASADGAKANASTDAEPARLRFRVDGVVGDATRWDETTVALGNGEAAKDALDAYKLASMAERSVALYTVAPDQDGQPLALGAQSLPTLDGLGGVAEIPLDLAVVGATGASEWTLSWPALDVPDGWRLTLVDTETGAEVDLRTRPTYAFSLAAPASARTASADTTAAPMLLQRIEPSASEKARTAGTAASRFLVRIAGTATADEGGAEAIAFGLEAPRPNPARGVVRLAYGIDAAGPVRLTVYDVLGREVTVAADEPQAAGRHEVTLDVASLPAGVYVVRLTAGGRSTARSLTVVR